MEIYYSTPYALDGDLGKAYNRYMNLLPSDDDWMVFTDGDTMWLMPDYGHQINDVIKRTPQAGLITCLTNRIGNTLQLHAGRISEDSNILNHKKIAKSLYKNGRTTTRQLKSNISGHCMIIKKSTWKELGGFPEGIGILDVDTIFTQELLKRKKTIYCMQGVYIFHYYRMETGIHNKEHLKVKLA